MEHIETELQPEIPASTPTPAPKSTAFYVKRTIGAILLVALAGVFFFSGYSKIYSDNAFDNFQWTFLDLGISSILVAGIAARLMIGFEFLLGLFLLFHIYLGKFTYKAVIAILSFFILYLLVVILKQGNSGNCGCFGDKLAMTPIQAIIKNVLMIAATVVLMYIYPVKPYKYQEWLCQVIGMVGLVAPFLLNVISTSTKPDVVGKPIDLNPLYKFAPAPETDMRKGKHIIAFMSLTCPHCKKAAYLLQIIHHEHPEYPIYIVLDGPETYKKEFFEETHAEAVPHLFYRHSEEFLSMAGASVPSILWVNNSTIEYKSTYAYYQLDPKFMEQWLKK